MMTTEMRYYLSIETIKYSDAYDNNFNLFNRGIKILAQRLKSHDFSEFTVDERTTLEEIFTIIKGE